MINLKEEHMRDLQHLKPKAIIQEICLHLIQYFLFLLIYRYKEQ